MATSATTTTRVLLATVAGTVALLAFGAAGAAAAPPKATPTCYLAVINDWVDNNRVDHTYAQSCYRKAIAYLNSQPDVQGYSSAPDDIRRAMLFALKHPGGGDGGATSGGGNQSGGGGPAANPGGSGNGTSGGTGDQTSTNSSKPSFFDEFGSKIGPGNAQSIPLPLLILGGLAILLLLAAAGAWIARRIQARRVAPAAPGARR